MTSEAPLNYPSHEPLTEPDASGQTNSREKTRATALPGGTKLKPIAEEPDTGSERYLVERYAQRGYQVRDGDSLIAVTVYRKGADEVRRQLASRDRRISELEARITALISRLTGREGP